MTASQDRTRRPSCRSPSTRKLRAERRRQIAEIKKQPPARGRAVRDVLFRDPTTRCCTRCRRCCYIEKGGAGAAPRRACGLQSADPAGQRAGGDGHVRDRRSGPPRPRARARWAASRTRPSCASAATRSAACRRSDQERTREDGKASSVQFMRFPFTPAADRRLPQRRRRRRRGLRPSQLRPHGGDAAGRASGAGARLRLTFHRPRAPGGL